jgi:hypothetical protein
MGTPPEPASSYEPQPGDQNLKRDKVLLELESSQILVTATELNQVSVILKGNLSDPCHQLRAVITSADAHGAINLEVYSVVDPSVACIMVITPFTATIPLGSYPSGQYSVMVNGEKLGEFGEGYGPQPGDELLTRDKVFLDMESSSLLTTGSQPIEASAILEGNLPDPCHQLRIVFTPADSQNRINLEVYSVFDQQIPCITVLEPFQVIYPMGSFSSGHYIVYVNGQLLGEFDA